MFYRLLLYFLPELTANSYLRVFKYTTVRAACALAFAFILSLILGPFLVRRLRALKVGQQVRHFKTSETQQFNIHQHKHGTPTMGGILILVATLGAVILFCDPGNSYVWVVSAIMLGAGALGFVDDYLTVVQKNHKGVSARGKLIVQILLGLGLGLFMFASRPHTAYGDLLLKQSDIKNFPALVEKLQKNATPAANFLRANFHTGTCSDIDNRLDTKETRMNLLNEINGLLNADCFYTEERFAGVTLTEAARERLEWHLRTNHTGLSTRLNRLLLESIFPEEIAENSLVRGDTYLLVPFFKNLYPHLGIFFLLWTAFVLTATSNAVNLTDGLDGLAIGTVITVSIPYMILAYIVSRFDFTSYLYIPQVPQADELSVFLAAMLGASLGFLWFNSHPAEVFMGDTGSLALGATIGAIAILCKQEILLVLIGGIFVIEALSVVVQVGSFHLRGKRVLLMSPLHNHFVKKGVDESKIIARFLIISTLLAMAGLSTLKLR